MAIGEDIPAPEGADDGTVSEQAADLVPLRDTATKSQAREWSLVLRALAIGHRAELDADRFVVSVDRDRAADAGRELDEYDLEVWEASQPTPEREPPAMSIAPALRRTLLPAALLAAIYLLTGPRSADSRYFRLGAASAGEISRGEWWRLATALTLHADPSHLLGNLASGVLFAAAVFHVLGSGLGVLSILLAGVSGNALTVLIRGAPYSSVGASTAVLGAVGVLASHAALVRRERRWWAPFAAGLALLALFGSSQQSDLLAHVCGFAAGGAIGLVQGALARGGRLPLRPALDALLGWVAVALIVLAWALAIQHAGGRLR